MTVICQHASYDTRGPRPIMPVAGAVSRPAPTDPPNLLPVPSIAVILHYALLCILGRVCMYFGWCQKCVKCSGAVWEHLAAATGAFGVVWLERVVV